VEDSYGHRINYLRVSVTDRCNERCTYCMPDEEQNWMGRDETLTDEELLRVIRVGTGLGIRKIRVTGGEPLVRPGVVDLLAAIRRLPGIEQLGLSSNGTLLARPVPGWRAGTFAEALREAGVEALNLSLDTLDREAYARTAGRDLLPEFLRGLGAARDAGFSAIRLNCVLARGRHEHELWDMVDFARKTGCLLRFIELMPVSTRQVLSEDNFLSATEARKLVQFRYGEMEPLPDFRTNGPALYYRIRKTGQKIGFIGAMTNLHFCESCNKLRLTADGKLRPCLGSHLEFDFREVLRDPATTDADVAGFFRSVVEQKPKEHDFRGSYQPDRRMIAIGG